MKIIFLAFLSITALYSSSLKSEMVKLFKQKQYNQLCTLGFKNFLSIQKDEEAISLYAFGCLYDDKIDNLAIPVILLKNSKEARANAAYFSTILMQKKLLQHSLIDGYKIASLNLPNTDYILSNVFHLYSNLKKYKKNSTYFFTDKKNIKISYKLYFKKKSIIIEEYYDNILLKKHTY